MKEILSEIIYLLQTILERVKIPIILYFDQAPRWIP